MMTSSNKHCSLGLPEMTATQAFLLFCTLLQPIFTEGQMPEPEPEFLAPLENHTVTQGRDIVFTCVVNHLSTYKVAWIKSDSKAILAINTHMVAQNPRLIVTHNGHNTWKLYIHNVQKGDAGTYMCQINTDPMRYQMGILNVVIPPDILPDNESAEGSGMAVEGGNIRLRCKGTGVPEPTVSWKRQDGKNIVLRHEGGREKVVKSFDGEVLTLTNVQRQDMGIYLCIAKNGVPPLVSKRFEVVVHFHPLISVTNQLLASPIARDVVMQCEVQASPKAMNHWMRDTGEKIISSDKYIMEEIVKNEYSLQMNLRIKNIDRRDIGGYICTSSNALGKAEGTVRLQEIHLPLDTTTTTTTPRYVVTKPHKPLVKPTKPKAGKARKKEYDNKKDEKEVNQFFPEAKTPSVFIATTTTQAPSIILQQRNCACSQYWGGFIYFIVILGNVYL
ncbi:lachesin-like [Anthonomus grandis grandis]|uniref:lachesin-like n=1 Tax=Anthonomus grandis grandis TaxID=2921223 RepID=UPI002166BC51|nr:lachesin-like [Anthonomus grandis grandis]